MKKIVVVLLSTLLFFSCVEKKTDKIKIGFIGPLTGDGATYGASMKKGAELTFDSDSTFIVIYEDSKLEPKTGVNAANKLINIDKVDIIYGAASSTVSLAIAPNCDKANKILFSSISTSEDLTQAKLFIRNVPTNELQGQTAAIWLIDSLGVDKIAIFNENDDYGVTMAKSFKKKVEALEKSIVFEDSYIGGTRDFRITLAKIKESNAQAVFIPGNYKESEIILKQAKQLDLNLIFMGGDGSYSPELIKIAGEGAEGFYCTIMDIDKDSKYYKEFETKFNQNYKTPPDIYDAYAYEACQIIKDAFSTGKTDTKSIYEYITSNEFNSMTGIIKFNENGDVIRKFKMVRVINEQFVAQ
nr:ABC transporter substrate-binding protein [uncultured Draconibacterium sp.]